MSKFTVNPATNDQQGRPAPVDRRTKFPPTANMAQPTGDDLRVASEVAALLRSLDSGHLFALVGGRDGLDALKAAAAALVGKPAPAATTTNGAPAQPGTGGGVADSRDQHAGAFAGYNINAVMAEADPALSHLDAIGRMMVAELHANHVHPPLHDEQAILSAFNELAVENARQELAQAEDRLEALARGRGPGAVQH